jgi:tRNA (guanine-N7-)-methyltransferase
MQPLQVWRAGGPRPLAEIERPSIARGEGRRMEIEIGFGKGRFLLARAAARPDTTFVGIESAPVYWRLACRRADRRGLRNLILVRGDALYVLDALVDREVADTLHVYFPDPWPKLRQRKRRLFDASTVDLVLGALAPGGVLQFATDHADYGEGVRELLERHPALRVETVAGSWPEGPRTNYEAKYELEGRPILRLTATRRAGAGASLLHPDGILAVIAE